MTTDEMAAGGPRRFRDNRLLQAVLVWYLGVWIWSAVDPHYPFDWFLENLLVFAVAILIVTFYVRRPLSTASYILIAAFLTLHSIGAHYTYSEVPLGDWMKGVFGFERNHYDRIVHFSFGLLWAYPMREIVLRNTPLNYFWAAIVAVTAVVTFSAGYEIIEWTVAEIVSADAAYAYLGTQGDPFDAQKDEALADSGAIVAMLITAALERSGLKDRPYSLRLDPTYSGN